MKLILILLLSLNACAIRPTVTADQIVEHDLDDSELTDLINKNWIIKD